LKKVIIADDIKSEIEAEGSFLKRSSIKLITVGSNEEALDVHSSEKADLIIANLDSPGMDADVLCSNIRESSELRDVSIIVLSEGSSLDIEKGRMCRTNVLISRPLNNEILIEKAHKLLSVARRMSFRGPIAVRVQGRYKDEPFLGYSENISSSGMLFESDRRIDSGEIIMCSFILPDATRVTSDAEVMRVVGGHAEFDVRQFGIRFIDMEEKFREAIEEFVKD
jgi:DNA-binding response OmpR family regulator